MTKLVIYTQVYENYGDADQPHWKAKGGGDYFVRNVDECDMVDVIVDRVRGQIECNNEMFREYIIGWRVVADDYLTEFERNQILWDGKITYPAQELEIAQ